MLLVSEVHTKSEAISEHLREDFEMIHRNIVLEAQLIDDLLDVSRIQQGKMRFEFKLVDVHEALARTLEMLRSKVEEKGIAVRQELGAAPATLEADPTRLTARVWRVLHGARATTRNASSSASAIAGSRSWCASVTARPSSR